MRRNTFAVLNVKRCEHCKFKWSAATLSRQILAKCENGKEHSDFSLVRGNPVRRAPPQKAARPRVDHARAIQHGHWGRGLEVRSDGSQKTSQIPVFSALPRKHTRKNNIQKHNAFAFFANTQRCSILPFC